MNMNSSRSFVMATLMVFALYLSGCSMLQETMASQTELPSVENQIHRAALGMALVRENNIMAQKMPLSADAKWPSLITSEISSAQKDFIQEALRYDPYYATAHYSKYIQRSMLGSSLLMNQLGDYGDLVAIIADQSISPLAYEAIHKLDILFANPKLKEKKSYPTDKYYLQERMKNWPDVFDFSDSYADFLDFNGGVLREVEAGSSDLYTSLTDALLSLAPLSMQKDLRFAHQELQATSKNLALLKAKKGEAEAKLVLDKAKRNAKQSTPYKALSSREKIQIQQEIPVLNEQIKELESLEESKEEIYYELLDQMVLALESDMNVHDHAYVRLAQNISLVAEEIQEGSLHAYTAFTLAITNLVANKALENLPREILSLGIAKANVPMHLQSIYNKRLLRITKNALYALPNALMGVYYATQQISMARKYKAVSEKIVEVYEIKKAQEIRR